MKTRIILVLIAAVAVSFSSCDDVITASGVISQQTHTISGFDEIEISDAFEAEITFTSGVDGIIIEADDNVHDFIEVKKIGDRLHIGVENRFNIMGPVTLKAYVSTTEDIQRLFAYGASFITIVDELVGENITIEASGASRIIGDININKLHTELSGASNFELSGIANDLTATLSGASSFGGYDLYVQDLEINLSGASNSRLTVDATLDVDASGASTMMYKGSGIVTHQNLSGGSQIIHVD